MPETDDFDNRHLDCLDIINARFPGYKGTVGLSIREGTVASITPTEKRPSRDEEIAVLDVGGDWLSFGGIDLQINGALGLAFPEVGPDDGEKLAEICRFLWQQGVDAFCPTLVTTSLENFRRSLETFEQFMRDFSEPQAARILGLHLEGPFLNSKKRGAHPEGYLLPPTAAHIETILGRQASSVAIVTLAPELDGAAGAIAVLCDRGITVSLGHSLATAAEAERAFDAGARMVTHAFNAMPGLHHREPGLLGAALTEPEVRCGLIADGVHVCPTMATVLMRAGAADDGIFLVSDALAPLGLPEGIYPWDDRQIEVKNGTARLPDGTLSGTTLPLLAGVANLVRWGACDLERAIAAATATPLKALGKPGRAAEPAVNLLRWQGSDDSLTWERLFSRSIVETTI